MVSWFHVAVDMEPCIAKNHHMDYTGLFVFPLCGFSLSLFCNYYTGFFYAHLTDRFCVT